jgi:DNA-binding NarL/FixJ family response regulator
MASTAARPRPQTIVLADAHELFRDGLANALREAFGKQLRCIQAYDYATLLQVLKTQPAIDATLIDYSLGGMPERVGIPKLRAMFPMAPVMMLGGTEEPRDILNAFRLGVVGYVPKTASPTILCRAVGLVLAGGMYVPPQMLLAALDGDEAVVERVASRTPRAAASKREIGALTPRQTEVLRELAHGKPNKLIARALGISEGTVKLHLATIFKILNVHNRTEAVLAAQASIADSPAG